MAYTSCLTGYIGLQGCGTATPLSGRYVNELQGISLKAVDLTADEEQVTFANVWADVQARTIPHFETKLKALFAQRFSLNKPVEAVDLTRRIDTTVSHAALARYRGVYIDLDGFESTNPSRSI